MMKKILDFAVRQFVFVTGFIAAMIAWNFLEQSFGFLARETEVGHWPPTVAIIGLGGIWVLHRGFKRIADAPARVIVLSDPTAREIKAAVARSAANQNKAGGRR